MSLPVYEVFDIRYAKRNIRRTENFLVGDPPEPGRFSTATDCP